MTDTYRTDSPASGGGIPMGTADTAKDEAANLKDGVVDAGRNVAGTAKDEAAGVVEEAKAQVSSLFSQVRDELSEQAATQQSRAAGGLRTLGDDLRGMSDASSGGIAADLVSQASSRASAAASWLDDRDPASLVDEVKNFARRRPGTFIAIAAAVGLLAGRITRSVASNASASSSAKPTTSGRITSGVGTSTTPSSSLGLSSGAATSGALGEPTLSTDATTATPLYSSLAGDEATGGTDGGSVDGPAYSDETIAGASSTDEFGSGNAQRPWEDER